MATIDWVIVGVIGLSTLVSIHRGFVKEALQNENHKFLRRVIIVKK